MADDARIEEQLGVVAREGVETLSAFHPVVALVAEEEVAAAAAEDEVVAGAAEGLLAVRAGDDEVLALVAEDQRQAAAAMDDVVALVAVEEVGLADIGAGVGDDVVAFAAEHLVDAVAGLDDVVSALAPDGIVAAAGDDRVGILRAADDEVLVAVDADVFGHAVKIGVPAFDKLGERLEGRVVVDRIRPQLLAEVHFQDRHLEAREEVSGHHRRVGVAEIGVAHRQLGEGVVLEFIEQVEALGPRQVVEPVGVLEVLHRHFEDEAEGRAQHAAE